MKKAAILTILSALALGGCATPGQVAFNKNSTTLPDQSQAVILLATTMKNINKPHFQPAADVLYVETPNANKKADRINFVMDRDGTVKEGGKTVYLYRGMLKPGRYVIPGILGTTGNFLIHASCFLPMHSDLVVDQPGIYYLGRVDGVIRPREDTKEFKAGSSIPLIDQAVAGISNGTWEVHIYDDTSEDLALYRQRFPVLRSANIQMHVLRPFNRARAQKWWEQH